MRPATDNLVKRSYSEVVGDILHYRKPNGPNAAAQP